MKVNVAIDGPSASGKSTIAKALAKRLNYTHIDTGAMYRACAYKFFEENLDLTNDIALVDCIKTSDFLFNEQGEILLDGINISEKIRSKQIDILTSRIAQNPKIREQLVKRQQDMAKEKGFVMDGRDIGSVVLPDAEVKFFQTATLESRAQRRFQQYQGINLDVTYEQIFNEIKARDENDTKRVVSPLTQMPDAYLLDTSFMSIEACVELAYQYVLVKLSEANHD